MFKGDKNSLYKPLKGFTKAMENNTDSCCSGESTALDRMERYEMVRDSNGIFTRLMKNVKEVNTI